jgi:hypothetical protein
VDERVIDLQVAFHLRSAENRDQVFKISTTAKLAVRG